MRKRNTSVAALNTANLNLDQKFTFGLYLNLEGKVEIPKRASQRERKLKTIFKDKTKTVLSNLQDLEEILAGPSFQFNIIKGEEHGPEVKSKAHNKLMLNNWLLQPTRIKVDIYSALFKIMHQVATMHEPAELVVSRRGHYLVEEIVRELAFIQDAKITFTSNGYAMAVAKAQFQYIEMIMSLMLKVVAYKKYTSKTAKGRSINLIKVGMTKQEFTFYKAKESVEPLTYPNEIETSFDGTYQNKRIYSNGPNKLKPKKQTSKTIEFLNKYRRIAFRINKDLVAVPYVMKVLKSTFPNRMEAERFENWVKENIDKTLYIKESTLTPDNGRLNISGYFGGIQVGFRKLIIEFVETEKLKPATIKEIELRLDLIKDSELPKDKVAAIRFEQYLLKAAKKEPVGMYLNWDNRMSGIQNQAYLTKDYNLAYMSGMTHHKHDGRNDILAEMQKKYGKKAFGVTMNKMFIKAGMRGLMYGAGAKTVLAKGFKGDFPETTIGITEVEHFIDLVSKVLPKTMELIAYLYEVGGILKAEGIQDVEYTTAGGINCRITALGKINIKVNTLLGNDREFKDVKVLNSDEWGAKVVAATSHMGDADILFEMVMRLAEEGVDLFTIFDDYIFKANAFKKVLKTNVKVYRDKVNNPGEDLLTNFVDQILAKWSDRTMKRMYQFKFTGDLRKSHIVNSLYE